MASTTWGILKWLFGFPGYLLPWQLLYALPAVLFWTVLTPPPGELSHLSFVWIGKLFVRNLVVLLLFAGILHCYLYVRRTQDIQYKYDSRWPAADDPVFLWRSQTRDNVFWNLASAVPVWTGYEAITFWLQANDLANSELAIEPSLLHGLGAPDSILGGRSLLYHASPHPLETPLQGCS